MPGETHFFDDIYARRAVLGDPRDPRAMERVLACLSTLYGKYNEPGDQDRISALFLEPAVVHTLQTCHSYRDLFSTFMDIQTRRAGKRRWGNNVPKDIFSIKEIISFYPDATILICIRDVRDFLLSYQYKWRITSQENVRRLQRLYHPIMTSLLWKSSVKQIAAIRALVPETNLKVVRYESLVTRPEEVVRSICALLNEEFEAGMLAVETHNSSFQEQTSGIFSAAVGRWRTQLSKEEVYLAQKLARRELELLGYTTETVRANPYKLAQAFLTLPFAVWRALDANKEIRGPLVPYLLRRVPALWLSKRLQRI
jgi:hypothetical protein